MLYAYAQFIGETAEYVLNQLVETMLAKYKEFVALRAEHPASYVPLPDRQRRKQNQAIKGDSARPSSLMHAGPRPPSLDRWARREARHDPHHSRRTWACRHWVSPPSERSGVFVHPVDPENPLLGLMALQNPPLFRVLTDDHAS